MAKASKSNHYHITTTRFYHTKGGNNEEIKAQKSGLVLQLNVLLPSANNSLLCDSFKGIIPHISGVAS